MTHTYENEVAANQLIEKLALVNEWLDEQWEISPELHAQLDEINLAVSAWADENLGESLTTDDLHDQLGLLESNLILTSSALRTVGLC